MASAVDTAEQAPRGAALRRSSAFERRRIRGLAAGLLTVSVFAGAWWALAPTQLGGSTTMVVVDGSSMLPRFRASDLVALRGSPAYRIGDVVGYRSRLLHRIVLHRIVAVEHGRFVMKGDNNSFRDPELVPRSRIVGKVLLHVGRLGIAVRALHIPWVLATLAGLLVLAVGAGNQRRRR